MFGFILNLFNKKNKTSEEYVPDIVFEPRELSEKTESEIDLVIESVQTPELPEQEHSVLFDEHTLAPQEPETSPTLSAIEIRYQKILKERQEEYDRINDRIIKEKEIDEISRKELGIYVISDWDLLKRYIMLGPERKIYNFSLFGDHDHDPNKDENEIECLENLIKDPENYQKILYE